MSGADAEGGRREVRIDIRDARDVSRVDREVDPATYSHLRGFGPVADVRYKRIKRAVIRAPVPFAPAFHAKLQLRPAPASREERRRGSAYERPRLCPNGNTHLNTLRPGRLHQQSA